MCLIINLFLYFYQYVKEIRFICVKLNNRAERNPILVLWGFYNEEILPVNKLYRTNNCLLKV